MLPITQLKLRLDALLQSNETGYFRLDSEIEGLNLPGWLKAQSVYPKTYWQSRESIQQAEYATLGAIDELNSPQQLISRLRAFRDQNIRPRYIGGHAFDPDDDSWQEAGSCRFILPALEICRQGNHYRLSVNCLLTGDNRKSQLQIIESILQSLVKELPLAPVSSRYTRLDTPDQQQWRHQIQTFLKSDLNKVVLSRKSQLKLEQPINGWDLFDKLCRHSEHSFHYAFEFTPDKMLLSCSPERLYLRHGDKLKTEALAGSIGRSGSPQKDQMLAQQLLDDPKNIRENQYVADDIEQQLAAIADSIKIAPVEILPLRLIQHLRRPIQASLKPEADDAKLLAKLHPTPAVSGTPRRQAREFIRRHEPYRRGWYAGVCGFSDGEVAEFAVNIRCATLSGSELNLYAGAGIVEGSDPDQEWQELNHKIANLLLMLEPEHDS
ncbi:isochorismate synthase [Dongshaea marina]|uniref:isochorismate synthase n=1 Tax=Dongshaea marina TaxID=2047966 RepID=UPI000D3EA4C6|nr:isochorismate synthase [Dongshaea marina]